MKWRKILDWKIEIDERALKELKKLGQEAQRQIIKYLRERVAKTENPRTSGNALVGNFAGLWRYRLGEYRIICQIKDKELIILVLRIAHRKNVYI